MSIHVKSNVFLKIATIQNGTVQISENCLEKCSLKT